MIDGFGVQQQHDQSIDADGNAAARRQAGGHGGEQTAIDGQRWCIVSDPLLVDVFVSFCKFASVT